MWRLNASQPFMNANGRKIFDLPMLKALSLVGDGLRSIPLGFTFQAAQLHTLPPC